MKGTNLIDLANEQVSIITVCTWLGVEVEGIPERRKVHCPFEAIYHSDGGIAPAMRIYIDTNTAYCFNCSTSFTPVRLYAQATDLRYKAAAIALLDRAGHRPADPQAVWQRVAEYEPEVDKALLAEALKTYCRRVIPGWSARQFEQPVAARLTRCLAILDLVFTPEDASTWLSTCKAAMRAVMKVQHPSVRKEASVLLSDVQARQEGST